MRRKVIKHGASTLTVSLPLSWAKRYGVKKGDELVVEEKGRSLYIMPDKIDTGIEKREIDIASHKRLGISSIMGFYRDGFDEITMKYDDSDYVSTIQETINTELKGFEIVKQTTSSCTIRDLLGIEKGDFDLALRRLWILTLSMAEDVLEALKNNDSGTLEQIRERDARINGFANYCVRIIMKKGLSDTRKNCIYYYMVTLLEDIADQYKEISGYLLEQPGISKSAMKIFAEVNACLRSLYELVYKFDAEKTEKVFGATKKLPAEIKNLMQENNNVVLCYVINISEMIRSLLDANVELNG